MKDSKNLKKIILTEKKKQNPHVKAQTLVKIILL